MKRARKSNTPRWKDGSARTHLSSTCLRLHMRIFTMSLKTIGSDSQRGFWCIQEVNEKCSHANVCMFQHVFAQKNRLVQVLTRGRASVCTSDLGENEARGGSSHGVHCAAARADGPRQAPRFPPSPLLSVPSAAAGEAATGQRGEARPAVRRGTDSAGRSVGLCGVRAHGWGVPPPGKRAVAMAGLAPLSAVSPAALSCPEWELPLSGHLRSRDAAGGGRSQATTGWINGPGAKGMLPDGP